MHNAVGAFSVGVRNFVEASHAKIITARDKEKGRDAKRKRNLNFKISTKARV